MLVWMQNTVVPDSEMKPNLVLPAFGPAAPQLAAVVRVVMELAGHIFCLDLVPSQMPERNLEKVRGR
jgi:hypothetical protein